MDNLEGQCRYADYWDNSQKPASKPKRLADYWNRLADEMLPHPAQAEPPPVLQTHDPEAPYYDIKNDPQYTSERLRAHLHAIDPLRYPEI